MDAVPSTDNMPGLDLEKLCETPLQAATYKGDIERLQVLIAAGNDLNAVSGYFGIALQAACCRGKLDSCGLFLPYGANANSVSSLDGNPIHTAARNGYVEPIGLQFTYRAEIDAKGGLRRCGPWCWRDRLFGQ